MAWFMTTYLSSYHDVVATIQVQGWQLGIMMERSTQELYPLRLATNLRRKFLYGMNYQYLPLILCRSDNSGSLAEVEPDTDSDGGGVHTQRKHSFRVNFKDRSPTQETKSKHKAAHREEHSGTVPTQAGNNLSLAEAEPDSDSDSDSDGVQVHTQSKQSFRVNFKERPTQTTQKPKHRAAHRRKRRNTISQRRKEIAESKELLQLLNSQTCGEQEAKIAELEKVIAILRGPSDSSPPKPNPSAPSTVQKVMYVYDQIFYNFLPISATQ